MAAKESRMAAKESRQGEPMAAKESRGEPCDAEESRRREATGFSYHISRHNLPISVSNPTFVLGGTSSGRMEAPLLTKAVRTGRAGSPAERHWYWWMPGRRATWWLAAGARTG